MIMISPERRPEMADLTFGINAKAAGSGNYKPSAWKTVTLKIRVK